MLNHWTAAPAIWCAYWGSNHLMSNDSDNGVQMQLLCIILCILWSSFAMVKLGIPNSRLSNTHLHIGDHATLSSVPDAPGPPWQCPPGRLLVPREQNLGTPAHQKRQETLRNLIPEPHSLMCESSSVHTAYSSSSCCSHHNSCQWRGVLFWILLIFPLSLVPPTAFMLGTFPPETVWSS
jgi:hypothetical protein